jgi:hypothetical protein
LPIPIGRLTATFLSLCALTLGAPAVASAGIDAYFSGSLSSTATTASGYASISAHTFSTFTQGQADHNDFCASWASGVAGTYASPANGTGMGYTWNCSVSGGFASVSAPGGISGSSLHGTVWARYGTTLTRNFTTNTSYSW